MAKVLVVDDERGMRDTMQRFLQKEGHDVAVAQEPSQALELLASVPFDVVVSDLIMPGMSGMDLLRKVKELSPGAKVIIITGEPSLETAAESVRSGAFDYISKPVARDRLVRVVSAAARVRELELENQRHAEQLEALVQARTSELQESLGRLHRAVRDIARVLSAAMEMRDPYTAGHQRRVTALAVAIAKELGLDRDAIEGLQVAGLLHDIGKLQIPTEILVKPTRLSAVEFALVKTHPEAGDAVLDGVHFPWPIATMVRQHHERMDGTGYPDALKGDEILLESRVLAVADVVEAMATHRPYRPALGLAAALGEIEAKRGSAFDARVVDACLCLFREKGLTLEPGV